MDVLEIIGVIITLVSIWLMIREHAWSWIMAIMSCLIYIFIYWKAQLYSDAELQFVYIGISVYGFILWYKGIRPKPLPITVLDSTTFSFCVLIVVLLGILSGYIHQTYTDARASYLDAMTTSTCIVAQWMMARKYFQCWYLWIIANLAYIVLYFQASLWLTLGLYVVILFLNLNGFWRWRKSVTLQLIKTI